MTTKWIKIDDKKKPNNGQACFVYHTKWPGYVYEAFWNESDGGFVIYKIANTSLPTSLPMRITHWLPMPDRPKE